MYKVLILLIFSGFLMFSCQKQSGLSGNGRLFTSTDSVYFDTVFTSAGAVTQQIKLINTNDQDIAVNTIALAGGSASPFIINVDGNPGPEVANIKIPANDSLYIFVTVYINPGGPVIPFILQDSIGINYNGYKQYIKLSAWGQNAHFLKNQVISGNTNWPNDLPYVILGGLLIDSNASLTIQPGVHIYMHADAPIYVDGSMKALGTAADSQRVYFAGDRLDYPYNIYPGTWPGIYFRQTSKDNLMNYTVIQNGYHSLVVDGPSMDLNPKLTLNECIINNSYLEGILAIQTSITAINCLISNCGQNIVIGLGGDYQFEHCTVATYSTILLSHQQPVLTVSNAATNGSQIFTGDLNAAFKNCIFWGSQGVQDEALILKQGTTLYHVLFDHSILKQQNYPSNIDSLALFLNVNPLFTDTAGTRENPFNFHVDAGSPAVNQGADLGITIDLDGNPRPVDQPDLGCYERQ